jgi:hypothetical protein
MRETTFPLYEDEKHEVFLSQIADSDLLDGHQFDLGDDHGFFICEIDKASPLSGIEVLGKVSSYDAAIKLFEMYTRQTTS